MNIEQTKRYLRKIAEGRDLPEDVENEALNSAIAHLSNQERIYKQMVRIDREHKKYAETNLNIDYREVPLTFDDDPLPPT